MRISLFFAAVLLPCTPFVALVSASSPASTALSLGGISPCGIQCMLLALPSSVCALDQVDCVCQDSSFAKSVSTCMLAKCTMAENLGLARVQADVCNFPRNSRAKEIVLWTALMYVSVVSFVTLRILGRYYSKHLAWDDLVVLIALLLSTVAGGCVIAMAQIGLGEHVWNLQDGMLLRILQFFYIGSLSYVTILGLLKVSIVIFYLDICETRRFRTAAYITLACIIVNNSVLLFTTAFMCSPIHAFWNRDIKGTCIDVQALAYATSTSALSQDVVLILLPLTFLWNLNMDRLRKVQVACMFFVGTCGCIASIVRLFNLRTYKLTEDPSWDLFTVTMYTEIELTAGMICVSLPAARIFVVRVLPAKARAMYAKMVSSSSNTSELLQQEAVEKTSGPRRQLWGLFSIKALGFFNGGRSRAQDKLSNCQRPRSTEMDVFPQGNYSLSLDSTIDDRSKPDVEMGVIAPCKDGLYQQVELSKTRGS